MRRLDKLQLHELVATSLYAAFVLYSSCLPPFFPVFSVGSASRGEPHAGRPTRLAVNGFAMTFGTRTRTQWLLCM